MKHVMVDIETLGTRPGSVILSIGACRFDETGVGDQNFYRPIDVLESLMLGLKVDEPTIGFWRLQPAAARAVLTPGRPLQETMSALTTYILDVPDSIVWAKGPDFDMVFVDAVYRALKSKAPWRYSAARDVRTILALAPDASSHPKYLPVVKHHALQDAIYQAGQVIAAAEKLGVVLSEMA
jgi:hypothetical protein